MLGDPTKVLGEILQAQQSGRVLSSDHPHLIDEYLDQWIALHNGEVVASSESFEKLLERVDDAARSHVLVRFIARNEQKMIL